MRARMRSTHKKMNAHGIWHLFAKYPTDGGNYVGSKAIIKDGQQLRMQYN